MYARGMGEDSLLLYLLDDASFGCITFLDVTSEEGEILFIPAGFPHSVDTVNVRETNTASINLTLNVDLHIWDLDYLNGYMAKSTPHRLLPCW